MLDQIVALKERRKATIRDWNRERVVMDHFSDEASWVSPILNLIFEFSVLVQKNQDLDLAWMQFSRDGVRLLQLEGDSKIISFIAGIVLGRFGKLVFSEHELPRNLEIGFAITGAHIVNIPPRGGCALLKINSEPGSHWATLNFAGASAVLIIPENDLTELKKSDLEVLS
ncbi:MAG TPA: hypothetical protein VKU79_00190 [Thermoplasmataceae archaeon]|nr:hypothetical protein [Thermoplasmataceae archaeon]